MSSDAHLTKMMELFFHVVESERDKPISPGDEWKNDAQVLAVKIFRHIASAQQISTGMLFDFGEQKRFTHIDHSTVAIVVRAALEAYLALKYIFTNSDESLSIYRHRLWVRSGLMDRSKMLANTEASREVLSREAEHIISLTEQIRSSPFYLASNRDTRRKIDKGDWKPEGGWYSIIQETEIHPRYFNDIYNHHSGHSHASFISAIQIRDADTIEAQNMLASAYRQTLCLVAAHLLFTYIQVFPGAELVLKGDQELFDIADAWHIQKKDMLFIYGS